MQQAFAWVKENGGLCSLEEYPYESGDSEQAGKCKTCKVRSGLAKACRCLPAGGLPNVYADPCPQPSLVQVVSGTSPTSWVTVPQGSERALASALAQQPVSVAVAASQDWM